MSNYCAYLEMTTMFETLRLRLKLRELKTRFGEDQAWEMLLDALRLEFEKDLDITRPELDHSGSKKVPVAL